MSALRKHILPLVGIAVLYVGLIIGLTGCSGWKPYGVVGIGAKLPPTSSELLGDGRNPTARLEGGWENKERVQIGWCHTSHWIDGFPLNSNPEFQLDELCVKKTWGGWKR